MAEPFVTRNVIDETWKRVGASSGSTVIKLQKRHFKLQKPLSTYIAKHIDLYREEAAGVFLYVAHVILEAALSCNPRPRRISASKIQTIEDDSISGDLADPGFHLTNYAYEAFAEIDDVNLGANEIESMLDSIQVITASIHTGFLDATT